MFSSFFPFSKLGLLLCVLGSLEIAPAQLERESMPDNVLLPQRRTIRFSSRGDARPVEITHVAVKVLVRGAVAETTWEMTVKNPSSVRQEAVLTLPVPEKALLKGFSYGVPGQGGKAPARYPARLLSAGEARQLYDWIVGRALDPALLEFAGYGVVRSSVFPVDANSFILMNVTYEQVLDSSSGRCEYVLPRTEAVQQADWELKMEIEPDPSIGGKGGSPVQIYSPSHEIRSVRMQSGVEKIELAPQAAGEPGSFRLYWKYEKEGTVAPGFSLFACPPAGKGKDGYFFLLWEPENKPSSLPREVTLVLDRSGSMRGDNLTKVKAAARRIVQHLGEKDFFNLIAYNEGVDCFSEKPVARSAESEKAALAWIDSIEPRGGTNIHEAMKTALAQPGQAGIFPLVLFLTDGLPTIGETSEKAIVKLTESSNLTGRRVFTLGVGTDVNAPLLRRIGEVSRAESLFILPGEDVAEKMILLDAKLRGPLLVEPVVTVRDSSGAEVPGRSVRDLTNWACLIKSSLTAAVPRDVQDVAWLRLISSYSRSSAAPRRVRDVTPVRLPDVFGGSRLVLTGRYVGDEPLCFVLEGKEGGKDFSSSLEFDPATAASMKNDFVPRLWASRKIGVLQAAIADRRAEGNGGGSYKFSEIRELLDEIVRLSVEFGIMTEYTSFFADDGNSSFAGRGRPHAAGDKIDMVRKAEIHMDSFQERSGMEAVAETSNVVKLKNQAVVNKRNLMLDEKGKWKNTNIVRHVGRDTFYLRNNVWVERALWTVEKGVPNSSRNRKVLLGTPEYGALVDRLVSEGRQGLFSLEGEVNFNLGSESILLKNS